MPPNNAANLVKPAKPTEIFFAAAAGTITKAPIRNTPVTLSPKATMTATKKRKRKFILETLTPMDWASCLEITLNVSSRYILNITKNTKTVRARVIKISTYPILAISPNNASSSSGSGVIKMPKAKLKATNIPTNVSDGSSVFLSKNHMPITAKNKAAKAPKNGLTLKIRAIAIPGRATWEIISPTRDILFNIMNEPRKPAPKPISIPTKICKNKGSVVMFVFIETSFSAIKFSKRRRIKNYIWFAVANHFFIYTDDIVGVFVNNVQVVGDQQDS